MKLPQLTIRDLFWLIALVAVCCAWWVDRKRQTDHAAEAARDYERQLHASAQEKARFVEAIDDAGATFSVFKHGPNDWGFKMHNRGEPGTGTIDEAIRDREELMHSDSAIPNKKSDR